MSGAGTIRHSSIRDSQVAAAAGMSGAAPEVSAATDSRHLHPSSDERAKWERMLSECGVGLGKIQAEDLVAEARGAAVAEKKKKKKQARPQVPGLEDSDSRHPHPSPDERAEWERMLSKCGVGLGKIRAERLVAVRGAAVAEKKKKQARPEVPGLDDLDGGGAAAWRHDYPSPDERARWAVEFGGDKGWATKGAGVRAGTIRPGAASDGANSPEGCSMNQADEERNELFAEAVATDPATTGGEQRAGEAPMAASDSPAPGAYHVSGPDGARGQPVEWSSGRDLVETDAVLDVDDDDDDVAAEAIPATLVGDGTSRRRRRRRLSSALRSFLNNLVAAAPLVEGVVLPEEGAAADRPLGKSYAERAAGRCGWGHPSHRNKVMSAVALMAVVVAVVLAAVLTTRSASSSKSEAESTIKALVGQLSTTAALEDPNSPQRKALRWITEDDGITEEDGLTMSPSDVSHLLQRYALAVFFYSTGGISSWMDRFGFLSNEHECEWRAEIGNEQQRGVMCNDRKEVVEIYLDNNNLTGTLPGPELAAFPSLSHLQLASNRLQGSLPEELVRLLSLRQISMRNNSLGGALMKGIGNLRSLETLDLGLNKKLTSTIPPSIGNLRMLKVLDLEENQISGSLPSSIGNMSSLHTVYISRNRLTSTIPKEWGNLDQLKYFHAAENELTGTLPLHPFRHQNLTSVLLFGNRLTGTIPPSLGTLPKLQVLLLMYNQFRGLIPVTLANLTELKNVGLLNNSLTGTIPPTIFEIESLQWLELGDNRLTGSIPNNVGNPSRMLGLGMGKNQLTGTIPSSLGNLPFLIGLTLHLNMLSGTIPSSLGENFHLFALALENNILTGVVPESFRKLVNIQWLSLARNNLTGSLDHICALEGSPYRQITADCTMPGAEVTCDCCASSLCCEDAVGDCDHHFPIDTYFRNCIAGGTCPNFF